MMNMKRYIIAVLALTVFGGFAAKADTDKLTTADGWTKITSLPTATDIANNYYVFVDNSNDLMLGVAKGGHQDTKWYSLGLYYQTSVEPTSADINGKTWILETQSNGFAMRNLEYPALVFQTEYDAPWKWDTNDVTTPNGWAKINLAYANGYWTIENGHDAGNYIGPWNGGNFTDGAECAGNKTAANEIGKFQIYTISRAQFKQNLLDNASGSNPVDLTPWYVTNATFDTGNRTGWTEEGSGGNNNTSFGGGCEIWHRSNFKIYQNLTVPNGKYKVSLQIAGTTGAGQVYGISGSTTKTVTSSAAAGSDFQATVLSMIQDRTFGKVTTDEIEVSNGALQMGMKCETTNQWLVFDNFKLYCTGVDLSAYETQLSELVDECNDFITSAVVPQACGNAISSAITMYNKSYSTAKEYSSAIIALTAVLDTYRNDTELQTAYANYKSMRSKVQELEDPSIYHYTDGNGAKTTFDGAIAAANTAVEAATSASTINTQTANIRAAALTFISNVTAEDGNPFNLTFLASTAATNWQTATGLNAAATAPSWSVPKPDENMADFVESYTEASGGESITGNILYQTLSNMPAGYYTVALYAAASYTPNRGSLVEKCTDGQPNITFGFANESSVSLPVAHRISLTAEDQVPVNVSVQLPSTGSLTFGIKKTATGSNWHVAQIYSITYSKDPDLTVLKADRDALVSEAEGLLASSDAAMLTESQKNALQNAIDDGKNAETFDDLNNVTLTILPNAIQTVSLQIQQVKDNRVLMIAALERFEKDYNLADGTDYSRMTMSADAWETLIEKVNAVTEALDDVSLGSEYATRKDALVDQMDATDASLRLFKSYKAMSDGVHSLAGGSAADSEMDSDDTEAAAIIALNTAFDAYALQQTEDFSVGAFLGDNLDFNAAAGSILNGENSNTIKAVTGWEVDYADAKTWAVLQTDQEDNVGKLYIRSNWTDQATKMTVIKEKMLPVGNYRLSLLWNSDLANMTNLSCYKLGNTSTTVGKATDGAETLTYDFTVTEPTPFDLVIGFQKTGTGNSPAQMIVDDIVLTYMPLAITLADNGTEAESNVNTISNNNGKCAVVTLQGRTLFKDGSWNTLCLPFNMTEDQVSEQLAPAALMELDTKEKYNGHQTGLEGTTLYLYFKNANAITAGKPYIIKWAEGGTNVTDPVFHGVTVSGGSADGIPSADGTVTFKGTYTPTPLVKDDPSNLYLGAGNHLYWPAGDNFKVNAFRAYFSLSSGANVRAFNLNFIDSETTGIKGLKSEVNGQQPEAWHDLNGRRLVGQPMRKGIYIKKGRKVIIK